MGLTRLLSNLHLQRFSGQVRLDHGEHRITMWQGLIRAASAVGEFDPLGQILVRQRRLAPRDLHRNLERMILCERLQGQLLREAGLVTGADIEQALRDQLCSRVQRLLSRGERLTAETAPDRRPPRPVGPQRPLHPYSAIWHHILQLPSREVERRSKGHWRLRTERPPPAWLLGSDGHQLLELVRQAQPVPPGRQLLFLVEAGFLTGGPAPAELPVSNRAAARRAFHRLALALHPDRHPKATDAERAALTERFARVTAAYQKIKAS